jgi:hypothetical protein
MFSVRTISTFWYKPCVNIYDAGGIAPGPPNVWTALPRVFLFCATLCMRRCCQSSSPTALGASFSFKASSSNAITLSSSVRIEMLVTRSRLISTTAGRLVFPGQRQAGCAAVARQSRLQRRRVAASLGGGRSRPGVTREIQAQLLSGVLIAVFEGYALADHDIRAVPRCDSSSNASSRCMRLRGTG